jgi:hypothetical protein
LANSGSPLQAKHSAVAILAGAAALVALSACDAPFNLGQPSTRALENGAADSLTAAKSFEVIGSYSDAGDQWSIDLQVVRPAPQHILVSKAGTKLEAIILNFDVVYFRGSQFLSDHMGPDLISRNLVRAAGNAWWKGPPGQIPQLPDLTDGNAFKTTFLGTAVSQRTDHVEVDGLEAVNLSGPRADVFIAAEPPYHLIRVHLKKGAFIDGISDADLHYSNFDTDFKIVAPTDVIDFSNLSTLPPIYTVVSVDTSRCGSPCVVSASLKNLGGKLGAQAPSTIKFTMTDSATKQPVGSCQAQVQPDVGYNATTSVSCTITIGNADQVHAGMVTATPDNPGRA